MTKSVVLYGFRVWGLGFRDPKPAGYAAPPPDHSSAALCRKHAVGCTRQRTEHEAIAAQ
jgi:hypothetical protein